MMHLMIAWKLLNTVVQCVVRSLHVQLKVACQRVLQGSYRVTRILQFDRERRLQFSIPQIELAPPSYNYRKMYPLQAHDLDIIISLQPVFFWTILWVNFLFLSMNVCDVSGIIPILLICCNLQLKEIY